MHIYLFGYGMLFCCSYVSLRNRFMIENLRRLVRGENSE